jgi:hypothetical protein
VKALWSSWLPIKAPKRIKKLGNRSSLGLQQSSTSRASFNVIDSQFPRTRKNMWPLCVWHRPMPCASRRTASCCLPFLFEFLVWIYSALSIFCATCQTVFWNSLKAVATQTNGHSVSYFFWKPFQKCLFRLLSAIHSLSFDVLNVDKNRWVLIKPIGRQSLVEELASHSLSHTFLNCNVP